MAGYHETQVRRAMPTVGDTDVLNEMAAGRRSSIPALREVEDELTAGIQRAARARPARRADPRRRR